MGCSVKSSKRWVSFTKQPADDDLSKEAAIQTANQPSVSSRSLATGWRMVSVSGSQVNCGSTGSGRASNAGRELCIFASTLVIHIE